MRDTVTVRTLRMRIKILPRKIICSHTLLSLMSKLYSP